MKLASSYAHALQNIQKDNKLGSEEAVSKLIRLLERKGHLKILPSIVVEFEKITASSKEDLATSITCAKEEDFKKYKYELQEHLGSGPDEATNEILDETIIGGFILRKGESVIDGSYKKKLLLIYQNAIA